MRDDTETARHAAPEVSLTSVPQPVDPVAVLHHLRALGVTHVITVPDTHQQSLLKVLADAGNPILLTACTEDEAMGMNLGLYMGGCSPMLLIQNSGFYAAVNTVRGLALDGRVPTPMLIGEFSRDPSLDPSAHPSRLVRQLQPTLDLWEIPAYRLDGDADLPNIPIAVRRAREERGPVAILVGATTAEAH